MKNLLVICLMLLAGIAQGQDIFQKNLYSADQIMENREKLNLTDAQSAKIKKIHADNAADFSTLKWDLDAATARLKSMLEESKIDPNLVNKQMDEVLRLESLLKKKQLNTLVAIKNELTSPQQKMLEYKSQWTIVGGNVKFQERMSSEIRPSNIRIGIPDNSTKGFTSTFEKDRVVSGTGAYSPNIKFEVENGNPNNTPLYILSTPDGEKELPGFDNIKAEDIESISVLKDKSATSKYGEKGKNGVIIITLKKNSKYYFQEK